MFYIVRREYLDSGNREGGLYKNEFVILTPGLFTYDETRKQIEARNKEEGSLPKYTYGYIKSEDLGDLWHK